MPLIVREHCWWWFRPLCMALILGITLIGTGSLWAQDTSVVANSSEAIIEDALSLEGAGDLAGASRLLGEVLEAEPGSVQALLAYERILRIEGRLDDLLPALERLLEDEPNSALAHQLYLRTLSELDLEDSLAAAVERWIESAPALETPYREVARIWGDRDEPRRALEVLERGRSQLGRGDALALEVGDMALAVGDLERVVEEWSRAIGQDARGFSLVRRRLNSAPDGGAQLVPGLIEELSRRDSPPARQRAAVELAIGAGWGREAEVIGRGVLDLLPREERSGFLVDVARRADGAKLPALAYWAYGALLSEVEEEPLVVRGRLGALALELGDTAAAGEHFLVLERAYESGSVERRAAVAVRIELIVRDGEVERAREELERFRGEYPEAPETDRLAAILADLLLDQGDRAGAERVLAGASGPRSGVVRGRLALQEGDLTRARTALLRAAPKLGGREATEAITLITLLNRLGPEGGELLSRALPLVGGERVGEAVGILVGEGTGLERSERSAILGFAAELADRGGLAGEAEEIRRMIVSEYPDRPEAPMALLILGRTLGREGADLVEARSHLERLIIEYPRSALVPQARGELERMRGVSTGTAW